MTLKKMTQIVLIIWAIIVSFAVVKNEYTLNSGRVVLLETVPVDPRDIVMGDYVILNYKIAQFPKHKDYLFEYGAPIYVKLNTNDDGIANIEKITQEKPNGLFLKGTMTTCPSTLPIYRSGKCISYGIESYYVKEGEGKELEKNLIDGALVKVSIDRYGSAKIKGFETK